MKNIFEYMISIIIALRDCKPVQYWENEKFIWIDCDNDILPNFNEFIYRIKPED